MAFTIIFPMFVAAALSGWLVHLNCILDRNVVTAHQFRITGKEKNPQGHFLWLQEIGGTNTRLVKVKREVFEQAKLDGEGRVTIASKPGALGARWISSLELVR